MDNETYAMIKKDPTKKLTNDIRNLLVRWKIKGYISKTTYNSTYCSDGNLPRAYGLPKIHPILTLQSSFHPLIVSSIN